MQQTKYKGDQEHIFLGNIFLALRDSTICLQSFCRGKLAGNQFEGMKLRAASTKVQKTIRKYQKWKAITKLRVSVLVLQTGVRAMDARKKFKCKKQAIAATVIQARWCCHKAYSRYNISRGD